MKKSIVVICHDLESADTLKANLDYGNNYVDTNTFACDIELVDHDEFESICEYCKVNNIYCTVVFTDKYYRTMTFLNLCPR